MLVNNTRYYLLLLPLVQTQSKVVHLQRGGEEEARHDSLLKVSFSLHGQPPKSPSLFVIDYETGRARQMDG